MSTKNTDLRVINLTLVQDTQQVVDLDNVERLIIRARVGTVRMAFADGHSDGASPPGPVFDLLTTDQPLHLPNLASRRRLWFSSATNNAVVQIIAAS